MWSRFAGWAIIPHLQEYQLIKSAFVHAKVSLYWSSLVFHEPPEGDTVVSFGAKFIDMSKEHGTTTYRGKGMDSEICWNETGQISKESVLWDHCVVLKNLFSSGYWTLPTGANPPLPCFNFIHDVGLTFHCETSLHYSPFFSRGSFSIEIRCSEYITLTCCCQHWFPFLAEIWCWNPLQADKYLYTWLPDLIAFCKGGCIGVALNACHSTLYSSSVIPCYAPRRALI